MMPQTLTVEGFLKKIATDENKRFTKDELEQLGNAVARKYKSAGIEEGHERARLYSKRMKMAKARRIDIESKEQLSRIQDEIADNLMFPFGGHYNKQLGL